ncbi:MAG: hypothetical protein ABIY50_01525, partial [Ignavibacteria bacterium]
MIEQKEKEPDNNIKVKAIPEKKNFVKRFFKGVLIFFTIIVLLLIGVFIFIQTDLFDKWALSYFLDKLNTTLETKESRIYAETLEGNLFNGFILNNGSITVKGDSLIKFASIKADYDIFKILDNGISLQTLVITDPKIILTEIRDKENNLKLNLLYLLESEEKDPDTSKFEFDWDITAEHVVIQNGNIRIFGENTSRRSLSDLVMEKLDTFDLKNFEMSQFFLDMGVNYFRSSKDVDVKSISFMTNSDFDVNKLSFYAKINKEDTSTLVQNLFFETQRSNLKINELFINPFNPFEPIVYEEFKDKYTNIDLDIKQFNFADLIFFFPGVDFLDSTAALNLKAHGIYSELLIDNLDLKTPNSDLSFSGKIKNLDNPSQIYFDIQGKNIEIEPNDTRLVVPGLDIPDFRRFGRFIIPSLTYVGVPERFNTDFDIRSAAGNAIGKLYFDLTQNTPRYKGDFSVSRLNIGKIVNDKTLESDITGDFIVDARGFDYRTATGKVNYGISRTKFLQQNISRSDGHLNFNNGNVNLDLSYFSDAVKTKLSGKMNLKNPENLVYDLKGTASNLNIAAFTKDNSQRSNLSFDFDVKGRGLDPNNMGGSYKFKINPSSFADLNIPATPLDIKVGQEGSIKTLAVNSNFADVAIEGVFNFNTLADVISNNIDKISSELEINNDTLNPAIGYEKTFSSVCKDLNLKYTLNVKDLASLNTFTGGDTINFKGKLKGNISDSCGVFLFSSKGVINNFSYGDSLFMTKDSLLLDINIKNDITGTRLTKFEANADISTNKIIFSKLLLDTTKINFNFFDNKNHFLITTGKDTSVRLYTEGTLEDSLLVHFDSLALRYQDFLLTNNKDLLVKYNTDEESEKIEFRQFSLNNLNQKLTVEGHYSLNDTSNIKILANNVRISTYQKLFDKEVDTTNIISGNLRRMEIIFNGTIEDPDIHVEANSDVLRLGGTRIGRLDAFINYNDDNLVPDIAFFNINNSGSFKLTGNIPYLNPLIEENNDSIVRITKIADRQVNINAVAKNFQLKVLQQLLPYTTNLEGILDGKISLIGTPEKPLLTGDMDVSRGKFYVTINKMNYNFNAKLSTSDERLLINDSKMFVADEPNRFITTTGYIDFTNLTINDIELDMRGDVKAFDKDNGQTELGISGDLYIGSGSPQLNLKGNSDRFDLTGNLIL